MTDAERARMKRLEAALERIAAFGEGPVVTSSFDEPVAAKIAREALRPETFHMETREVTGELL